MEVNSPNSSRSDPSYEQNLAELQNVVERLEKGSLSLEDSLELYEKGILLSTRCEEQLAKAEARIVTLGSKDAEQSLRKEVPLCEFTDGAAASGERASASTGGEF